MLVPGARKEVTLKMVESGVALYSVINLIKYDKIPRSFRQRFHIHTYIFKYIHAYILIYILTVIHNHLNKCIHIRIYMRIYILIYIHTYIHTYLQVPSIRLRFGEDESRRR
jgi:hypothetical protein